MLRKLSGYIALVSFFAMPVAKFVNMGDDATVWSLAFAVSLLVVFPISMAIAITPER